MLRTIFLLLLLPTFALADTPCPQRSIPYSTEQVTTIHLEVEDGIYRGDARRLTQLASCNFMIGPPDSDAGGFRRASRVMPQIARIMKGARFNNIGADYGTQVNFRGLGSKQNYELIYRKQHARWHWAGMAVGEETVLNKLLEGAYQIEDQPIPAEAL